MKKHLYNPRKIDLPDNLLLVPFFWADAVYREIRANCLQSKQLLHSDVLIFDTFALIVGFLGYPNILTLLECVSHLNQKEIYFLGTAGSLNPDFAEPAVLNISEIYPGSIFKCFAREKSLDLKTLPGGGVPLVKGISVDLIQRETRSWLRKQVKKRLDIVEMEIFPLRIYLKKPFCALVVTSDLISAQGIMVFEDKKKFKSEFARAYDMILHALGA